MTWWLSGGKDEGSATPLAGTIAWQTAKAPPGSNWEIIGSWSTPTVVAQASIKRLSAFSKKTGKPAWEITTDQLQGLPGEGLFCDISSAENGVAAVSFGVLDPPPAYASRAACFGVMLVDMKSGQIKWSKTVSPTDDTGIWVDDTLHLDIAGNMVVYGHLEKYTAISLASGQPTWTYDAPNCNPEDHEATTNMVVATLQCENDATKMMLLNPKTGAVESSAPLPKDSFNEVAKASPPVINSSNGSILQPGNTYIVFDKQGRKRSSISDQSRAGHLDTESMSPSVTEVSSHNEYHVVVSHGLLVTSTRGVPSQHSKFRKTNKIVAFDLDTGQIRWSKRLAKDYTGVPIGTTRDGVVAINNATYGKPSTIVQLSWKNGAVKPLSKPYPRRPILTFFTRQVHWDGNGAYAVNVMGKPRFGPRVIALR